jgi:hypothetical protein
MYKENVVYGILFSHIEEFMFAAGKLVELGITIFET